MAGEYNLSVILNAQNNASGVISGFLEALGPVGGIVAGLGAALIGVGVTATKMAADYQQGMNMVQALTGASSQQMAQYDSQLKQLAMNAGVAPTELTKGLYNVISAGYQGSQAMQVLTLAVEDAKIGMTDNATTSDALTNVLKSFTWQTKDANLVNGIMLETVTRGKSTFQQYASTISRAASSASQFHISLQTMSAAWATMTANGIRAKQASIDFVQVVNGMYGNIGTITKSLHKNGIAFDEAKFNAMSFGDKIVYLNSALQQANAEHVKITGVTLQAAQAIQAISQHMSDYNSNLADMSNKTAMANRTQQAWAITQSGFNQQMSRLKATVDVFMIDLGQQLLPMVTNAAKAMGQWFQSDIMPTLQQLYQSIQPIMPELQIFAKLLGGVLVIAIQTLGNIIAGLVKTISGAFQVIAGLIAFFVDLFTGHFNKLGGDLKVIWQGIINIFEGQMSVLTGMAPSWGEHLIQGFIGGIQNMIGSLTSTVKNVASTIASFLHFTKPDLGPLQTVDEWMPHMGEVLIEGLNRVSPNLQEAALNAAMAVSAPFVNSNLSGGITPMSLIEFMGGPTGGPTHHAAAHHARQAHHAATHHATTHRVAHHAATHKAPVQHHTHIHVNYTGNGKWTRKDAEELAKLLAEKQRMQGQMPATASGRRY